MHHSLEIDSNLLEVSLKLGQIPLWCILTIIFFLSILATIGACIFDVVFILLVYGVVRKMNIPLVNIFLIISVLLRSETS